MQRNAANQWRDERGSHASAPHPSHPQVGWAGREEERREAKRRSLKSLGHTYTAAASTTALLAGSCMPSWAEERRRPGRAPGRKAATGPTPAQRRALRRSRLPGTFRTHRRFRDTTRRAGAAKGASDLGIQCSA